MKGKMMRFIKKYWLPVWCVISVLSFCGLLAAAEYATSTNTMKKVVASTSDQGKMFSSNILVENGNVSYVAKYFSQHEEDAQTHIAAPYNVDVYLWNYSLNNLSKWYPTDIDYKMTFRMTDLSGESLSSDAVGARTVQIIKKSGDSETSVVSLSSSVISYTTPEDEKETLVHDSAQSAEDHYILRFSGNWDLDNDTEICVQVIAAPDNGGDTTRYKDLAALGAVIGLRKNNGGDTSGWQAYLAEQSANLAVENCDGYNLTVTGSGKAKITIKWDPSKLACNKYFYNGTIYSFGSGEIVYTANPAQIVINADTGSTTNDYRNRYDIQFYKKSTESSDWSFFKNDGSELGADTWLSVEVKEQ